MRRGLQVVMTIIGVVAVTAGAFSVIAGVRSVAGAADATASVDSELRFYAAWYVVAGVLAFRAARRVEAEATIVRLIAAGFFLAGCGRVVSLVAVGRPHAVALVLMVIELALPFVLIPWQATVARRAERGTPAGTGG